MQKILDFFKRNRQAVKWTICYIAVMWAILQGMFNFCMFSYSDWNKLVHAELHGFAGFVFGILILAALPLYVATTVLVVRNDAPLFKPDWSKIPVLPKLLKLFTPTTDTPAEAATPAATPQPEPMQPAEEPLPDGLPMEMRATFMRARHNTGRPQVSSFDMSHLNVGARPDEVTPASRPMPEAIMETAAGAATMAAPATDMTNGAMPLPADFDLLETNGAANPFDIPNAAPVFTEINFDGEAAPAPQPAVTPDMDEVIKYLQSKSIEFKTNGDIIITPTLAIASHTSNDFWIADDEAWFATGISRPSPVAAAINAAAAHGLRPVLYLGATNIMDLDARRAAWESAGVTVVTKPTDIPV